MDTPMNTVLARLWGWTPLLLPNVQVVLRLISMATPHRLTCILPAVLYGRYPNRWWSMLMFCMTCETMATSYRHHICRRIMNDPLSLSLFFFGNIILVFVPGLGFGLALLRARLQGHLFWKYGIGRFIQETKTFRNHSYVVLSFVN